MARKIILITRPRHDKNTNYLYYFAGNLISAVQFVNEHTIIDLAGEKAKRNIFESAVKKTRPRLIILNGHGSKEEIYGHKDEVILDEDNIEILNSSIVYAVACDSAYHLGPVAVDKGKADAYIGYESHFMIIIDETKTATLVKDKNIKPFEQVYARVFFQLIAGRNIKETIDDTKEFIKKLITEYGVYGVRDKFGDAPLIRFALYWDLYFLQMHGSEDAVF